jgi:hypothetical protein
MGKHHNIFSTDESGKDILKICPLQADDCFCCNYILREYNYQEWKKHTSFDDWDYLYYMRFEFDVEGLGNEDILSCFSETLTDTFLKSSPTNTQFITSNSFGLNGYFHSHKDRFTFSCLTFEIFSTHPFPDDLIRDVSCKIKHNYYLCECDFSFGSFSIRSDNHLSNTIEKIIERSLSLLKTENYPLIQMEKFQSIVSAGITHLSFPNGEINNKILNDRIRIN